MPYRAIPVFSQCYPNWEKNGSTFWAGTVLWPRGRDRREERQLGFINDLASSFSSFLLVLVLENVIVRSSSSSLRAGGSEQKRAKTAKNRHAPSFSSLPSVHKSRTKDEDDFISLAESRRPVVLHARTVQPFACASSKLCRACRRATRRRHQGAPAEFLLDRGGIIEGSRQTSKPTFQLS